MILHHFTISVLLHEELFADDNLADSAKGPLVPVDPGEWTEEDLLWALGRNYSTVEIIHYVSIDS